MKFVLGIDVACRAAHQATLADQDGKFVWQGHRFWSTPEELEGVWARVIRKAGSDGEVQVVMEPTRNAWVLLAYWFTARGASVVLVPTTQSADLRAYYCKHTKNDRLDSQVLARLPLLHPEGLHPFTGVGPADPLRRATRLRASLVGRRTASQQRLDAYLEILGPGWYQALGTDFGKTALAVLGRYANPDTLLRLGTSRLTQFLIRHSRGQWAEPRAELLLAAARQSQHLWGSDLDFAALAADQARRSDPQLAAAYKRLMENGAHHTSATCHIATRLLTRIASCVRNHQPYVIRDINGTPLTPQQGHRIVADRYQIDPAVHKTNRKKRASQTIKGRAGRGKKESPSAPSHRPATHENTPQELLDIR